MCMGLGCNAVGVTGCRIMPTRAEKLTAACTNAMMPCNGRFPMLLAMGAVLLGRENSRSAGAGILTSGGLRGRGRNVYWRLRRLSGRALRRETGAAVCIWRLSCVSPAAAEKDSERREYSGRHCMCFPAPLLVAAPDGAAPVGAWRVAGGRKEPAAVDCTGALDGVGRLMGMSGAILDRRSYLRCRPTNWRFRSS